MKPWSMAAIVLLAWGAAMAQQPPAPVPATQATTRPYTAHTYDDAVRELHERGFPATMDDLKSPAIPDDQNAAVLLTKAATMIVNDDSGPRNSALDYGPGLPYPQKWFELAEQSMVMHDELLKAARKARSCSSVSWNTVMPKVPHDAMRAVLSGISGQRTMANIIADAALLEHFKGNDAAALEYARDLVRVIDANACRPFLVSHLVATGMRSLTAETLLLIGTELRIADGGKPSGAVTGQEATRQQCKQMLAWLLDDVSLRDEQRRVILEERVYVLGEMNATGMLANEHMQQLLPQYLEWFDCIASGASAAHLSALVNDPLVKPVATTYGRFFETQPRLRMDRIAAAVAMAARMYEEDHGKYPVELRDLVPDYLTQVPTDPYSPTCAPVLYRGGKRPMVGSAGPDGIDAHVPLPARVNYNVQRPRPGESDDQWIDLTAWRQQ